MEVKLQRHCNSSRNGYRHVQVVQHKRGMHFFSCNNIRFIYSSLRFSLQLLTVTVSFVTPSLSLIFYSVSSFQSLPPIFSLLFSLSVCLPFELSSLILSLLLIIDTCISFGLKRFLKKIKENLFKTFIKQINLVNNKL